MNPCGTKAIPSDPGGFTLIEILVSLAISGIVLAGIFFVFDSSNKSYILQEDIARVQQNIRIAKYYIEKDLRMAGYGTAGLAFDQTEYDTVSFDNKVTNVTGVLNDTDRISLTFIDDDEADCGSVSGGGTACSNLPQLLLGAQMKQGDRIASVQNDLMVSPGASWGQACICKGLPYGPVGRKYMIKSKNGKTADILFITGVDDINGQIQNAQYSDGGTTWTNTTLHTYDSNSTINFFNDDSLMQIRYYIDTNYYLRRDVNGIANKLAENIEDLQVAFAGDFDGGGLDLANSGDWMNSGTSTMTAAQIDAIRYAKVTLLGRTAKTHKGTTSTRPGIEDHAGAGSADNYARRQLTFTVKIRNLGL